MYHLHDNFFSIYKYEYHVILSLLCFFNCFIAFTFNNKKGGELKVSDTVSRAHHKAGTANHKVALDGLN